MLKYIVMQLCGGLYIAIDLNTAKGHNCDQRSNEHLRELWSFATDREHERPIATVADAASDLLEELSSEGDFNAPYLTADAVYGIACLANGIGREPLKFALEAIARLVRDRVSREDLARVMQVSVTEDGFDGTPLAEAARQCVTGT
jgi:hypothetical protein